MLGFSLRRTGAVVAVAAVSTAAILGVNATSAAALAPAGTSNAYGLSLTATVLPPLVTATTGQLAPSTSTGTTTATVASVAVPPAALPLLTLLTTGVISSSATFTAATGLTNASASTAGVALPFLNLLPGGVIAINAITSTCTGTTAAVAGATNIVGGSIGGVALAAAPAANTTITIPNVATVILNEQVVNPDGSLTVNALHLTLLGAALATLGTVDLVLSSVTCGLGLAIVVPPVPTATVTVVATPSAVDAGHPGSGSQGFVPAELIGGVLLLTGLVGFAMRRRMGRQH